MLGWVTIYRLGTLEACSHAGMVPPIVKMTVAAVVIVGVIFLEVFACVPNDWAMLVCLIPLILTPVPLLLSRCSGDGDVILSSSPKGKHCARDALTALAQRARPTPIYTAPRACACTGGEFWSAFFLTQTIALPMMFYFCKVVSLKALVLSLSGVIVAIIFGALSAMLRARADDDAFHAW